MGKWSELPADLLCAIEDQFCNFIDNVRIRAVNQLWNFSLPKLGIPFLLCSLGNDKDATHMLFNPLDGNNHKIYLPEARAKLFRGSHYGWIVTTEDIGSATPNQICLINPLSRAQIKLPPRNEVFVRYFQDKPEGLYRYRFDATPDYSTAKVVMSSPPDHDDCQAFAILGKSKELARCRSNGDFWEHICTNLSGISDILLSKNILYAITTTGQVFTLTNFRNLYDVKCTEIVTARIPITKDCSTYLAECSDGSLIVVTQYFDFKSNPNPTHTVGFKLYNVDSNSGWKEIKSIGNNVLFVGSGSVKAVSSSDFEGLKGNRIYFSNEVHTLTSTWPRPNSDVGVFDLEAGTLTRLADKRIWPCPIWMNIRLTSLSPSLSLPQ